MREEDGVSVGTRKPTNLPPLMTLRQLAEHFNVSEKTAQRLPIPFTRIGRQRRYHPAIVAKYEMLHASIPSAWKSLIAEINAEYR